MSNTSIEIIINHLKENNFLQGLNLSDNDENIKLNDLILSSSILEVNKDENIIKKGDIGDSIFLLLKGEVGVYDTDNEKKIKITSLTKNSFFGEMALLDRSPRMATIKAESECLIIKITDKCFWDYFEKYPLIVRNLLKSQNEKIKSGNKTLIDKLIKEKEALQRFNQELEKQVEEKTEKIREKDIKLLQMDRIAGIVVLAAGVAHEINNPLGFLKSTISAVKKSTDKAFDALAFWDDKSLPDDLKEEYTAYLVDNKIDYVMNSLAGKFDRIDKGIKRIMKIVANMKSFSRVDQQEEGEIDINASITEAIEVLTSATNSVNIDILTEFGELPLLKCTVIDINQCLLNVLQNSIDSIEENGKIVVNSSFSEKEDSIVITITDNGCGMDEVILKKVFNPFFTTKPVGSGTGMGLSIAEKVMKKHNGNIDIKSKLEEGTAVTISFPAKGVIDEN